MHIASPMSARCDAFTLLEICLTLVIGVMLMTLAVPSVVGMLANQRLHETWDRFEALVNTARMESTKEQQPYRLVWEKHRVVLEAMNPKAGEGREKSSLTMSEDEKYELLRTSAMIDHAPDEWVFWPNGACEPVTVRYQGRNGRWQVRYDAFTPRGTFQQSETL